MNNDFYELEKKFNKIKSMGWVSSLRSGQTGVGYTFETLLNKKEDNLQLPDYKSIEIKTLKYFSRKRLHLFNATPESNNYSPIKTVVKYLGYPDKDYPQYKVFNISLNAVSETKVGCNNIILDVDKQNRKIYLLSRTRNETFRLNLHWSFDYIDGIIRRKMDNLAVVWAGYKIENNIDMFYYNKIDFYKYKGIDSFINLIESGLVEITFKISIYKDMKKLGVLRDRGTDFSIYERNLKLMYDKIN